MIWALIAWFIPPEIRDFEFIRFIGWGLFEAMSILLIPPFILKWVGRQRFGSPNWLSVWRLPITWTGYVIFFCLDPFIGFMVAVGGVTLDRIDGKVAKLLGLETETGKWLDPLIDKLTIPPLILWMAAEGVMSARGA